MPGELKLAEQFGVSRGTIRRMLLRLEKAGLVRRRKGKGTYPTALGKNNGKERHQLSALGDVSKYKEAFPNQVEIDFDIASASKDLKKSFGNQELMRIARVRKKQGVPFCVIVSWLTVENADRINWEQVGNNSVIGSLSSIGIRPKQADQSISAIAADEYLSQTLDIPLGSPVFLIAGIFYDGDGTPQLHVDGYFRPDMYEYRSKLHYKDVDGRLAWWPEPGQ